MLGSPRSPNSALDMATHTSAMVRMGGKRSVRRRCRHVEELYCSVLEVHQNNVSSGLLSTAINLDAHGCGWWRIGVGGHVRLASTGL